jgi:hypothetical protein
MANGNDPKLGLHVQTTADNKGLKETATSVKEVREEVKKLTPEQEQSNKKQDEAKEKTKALAKEKKGLVDQLRALGREFPIVNRLVDVIKNPYVLAATAVTLLASAINKLMEELQKSEAVMQAFGRSGAILSDIFVRAKASAEDFRKQLETIKREAAEAAAFGADDIGEKFRGRAEQRAAARTQKLGEIDELVKLGKFTPEQGQAEKDKVEKLFALMEKNAKRDEQNERAAKASRDLGLEQARLQQAEARLPELEKKQIDAEVKLRQDEDYLARVRTITAKEEESLLEQQRKLQAEVTGKAGAIQPGSASRLMMSDNDVRKYELEIDAANKRLTEIDAGLSRIKQEREFAARQLAQSGVGFNRAKDDYTNAQAEVNRRAQAVEGLRYRVFGSEDAASDMVLPSFASDALRQKYAQSPLRSAPASQAGYNETVAAQVARSEMEQTRQQQRQIITEIGRLMKEHGYNNTVALEQLRKELRDLVEYTKELRTR